MLTRPLLLLAAFVLPACSATPSPPRVTDASATSASPTATRAAAPSPTPRPTAARLPTPTPLSTPLAEPPAVALEPFVSGLERPIGVTNDGVTRTLYVHEQAGRVMAVQPDGSTRVFLDLRDRVSSGGERGLIGLAFDPSFRSEGGTFYVHYTDLDGNTVLSAFDTSEIGVEGAAGAEAVLLRVEQPYANHNGGQLAFGPDGHLYMGLGDGGSGGDPHGHGQNPSTLLGAILRLSVDPEALDAGYTAPEGNPFVAGEGAPEVWAYGLRNPWRFSFDRVTGELWIGDVGQGSWEEVNRIPANGRAGLNFGWAVTEGNHCFRTADCAPPPDYVPPLAEYDHSGGSCAVVGGYVYRGARHAALWGQYLFGDNCSGLIWSVRSDARRTPGQVVPPTLVAQTEAAISSFGEDVDGELYATDLRGGTLYRVVATP